MKINAFKINQYTNNGKNYDIYISSINIFDLKDYVYVKTVDDYINLSDEDKVKNNIFAKNGMNKYVETVHDIHHKQDYIIKEDIEEVQRNIKDDKIKSISDYLSNQMGIFPTSVLLGTKKGDFLDIKESDGIYNIRINMEKYGKDGFFIIDGQHRIYGLINHLYQKLIKNFNINEKEISEKLKNINNHLSPIVNRINIILNQIEEKEKIKFISENRFDLPVVIVNEMIENKMALLFADINSNSTKLEPNLGTWIYGKTDDTKKFLKVFVEIGEKLNIHPQSVLNGRFKIPTNLSENKLSKIGIKPFCVNSLKLVNTRNFNSKEHDFKYPFNLMFDPLLKYDKENSDDSINFGINSILVIYFLTFQNSGLTFGKERINEEEYSFINTNNLGLYLYMIKFITWKLYINNQENFLELFHNNDIITGINDIFNKYIKKALEETYENFDYFQKGKGLGSGASKEAEVVKFFKKSLYKIDMSINDGRRLKPLFEQKERKIINEI